MGYPVLGYPSFLALKNGHNAVQILGIFRPDKTQIKLKSGAFSVRNMALDSWENYKVNFGSR